jgi:hypothetical protein
MYQVTKIDYCEQVAKAIVKILKRDFKGYDIIFLTQSWSSSKDKNYYADLDKEEVEQELVEWVDGLTECGENFGIGHVVLYDPNAINQIIILRKYGFYKDVLDYFNEFANDETVDITTMIYPAIYLEILPKMGAS